MTCIAAVTDGKDVWMVGDSGTYGGGTLFWRGGSKVTGNDPYVIGTSGTRRFADVLRHNFEPPIPKTNDHDALDRFMSTEFVEAARKTLRGAGSLCVTNGEESADDSRTLIGVYGRLFIMDSHFGIVRAVDDFCAIGCGEQMAASVLYDRRGTDPGKRALRAVRAAAYLNTSVHAPLYGVNTRDFTTWELKA